MKYLGAILVDPVKRQNFAGKLHLRFYNIRDCHNMNYDENVFNELTCALSVASCNPSLFATEAL